MVEHLVMHILTAESSEATKPFNCDMAV